MVYAMHYLLRHHLDRFHIVSHLYLTSQILKIYNNYNLAWYRLLVMLTNYMLQYNARLWLLCTQQCCIFISFNSFINFIDPRLNSHVQSDIPKLINHSKNKLLYEKVVTIH